MVEENPKQIYIFSGKRKSGKDFFTEHLYDRLNPDNAVIIRLSAPIKSHWAKLNNLEYTRLLDATDYKENHRQGMLAWSEAVRNTDYGYFCRAAIEMLNAREKPIWIVSDARRKTDLQWFTENFGARVKTFRIIADDEIRQNRGWVFTPGIDDQETECGLDDVSDWTEVIVNNGSIADLEPIFTKMVDDLNNFVTKPDS